MLSSIVIAWLGKMALVILLFFDVSNVYAMVCLFLDIGLINVDIVAFSGPGPIAHILCVLKELYLNLLGLGMLHFTFSVSIQTKL